MPSPIIAPPPRHIAGTPFPTHSRNLFACTWSYYKVVFQQLRKSFGVTIHVRTDAPSNKGLQAMGRFFGCVLFSIVLLGCGSRTWAQTDVAVSVLGAFNQSTSGSVINQSPSNQAGFLIEARHIRNPLVGYEVTYAYNRANQSYTNNSVVCSGVNGCFGPTSAIVPANAHEFTADWVASFKVLTLRPFVLAGGGALINVPVSGTLLSTTYGCNLLVCVTNTTSTPTPTQSEIKASFIYGAGVDWTVLPHLGLRFQYRGRVYKAPDLATAFSSTGNFTSTSEPVIGAFFRF
jgi:opacity protein-like surface antigen